MLGFRLRERAGGQASACSTALAARCWWRALGARARLGGRRGRAHTPGARELREPIQRSAILTALNDTLPPSGALLKALARFDPFPSIHGPEPGRRPARLARSRATPRWRARRRSVVRVLGTACGLGVQGSGWVAGDGVVVTNAHVVAGQDDTTVQLRGRGPAYDAEAI